MNLKLREIENEIVFVKNDSVFTDSRKIAKEFNRRHDHVLTLIKDCMEDIKNSNYVGTLPTLRERKYKTQSGNEYTFYEMDRKAFMFLMMKMKGRKSDYFKLLFIEAFDKMEQWIKDRMVGKVVRLSMTDSIKNYLPDSPNKKFKYKHFTDLVYKIVLGKSKKQIEAELGHSVENLRDICTEDQLNEFNRIENEISVLLKYNKTYEEIKNLIK